MGRGDIDWDIILPEQDISFFEWKKYDTKKTSHGMILKEVCRIR